MFKAVTYLKLLLLLTGIALASPARAEVGVKNLSEKEFLELSAELSRKVNLFQDVWRQDPKTEFFGGTSRDFLYWVKGKFRHAYSREEAEKIRNELRQLKAIDVRDFIIGDSDVDIAGSTKIQLKPETYGIRKVDSHGRDIFNPSTEIGRSDIDQGFIPAEKIRLNSEGVIRDHYGNGAGEIYSGKLSLHAPDPEKFANTQYAKDKLNHPVLLALRYLRLQAMNYFHEKGRGFPDKKILFNIDPATEQFIREQVASVVDRPTLRPYIAQERFRGFLNGVVQKMFRSYTNPTAAMELAKRFRVNEIPGMYEGIMPINQFLFAEYRDEEAIAENLRKFQVKDGFYIPVKERFSDGYYYHGTRDEKAFHDIMRQGILASEDGNAGPGLYGVPEHSREFAESYGGDKNRLVRFKLDPKTKLVDITQEPAKKIFESTGMREDDFARAFGIDILRYQYDRAEAYIVENSAVLGRPEGVYRETLTLSRALDLAADPDPKKRRILYKSLELGTMNEREIGLVADELLKGEWSEAAKTLSPAELWQKISRTPLPDQLRDKLAERGFILHAEANFRPQTTAAQIESLSLAVRDAHGTIKWSDRFREDLSRLAREWLKDGHFEDSRKTLAGTAFDKILGNFSGRSTSPVDLAIEYEMYWERAVNEAGALKNATDTEVSRYLDLVGKLTSDIPMTGPRAKEITDALEQHGILQRLGKSRASMDMSSPLEQAASFRKLRHFLGQAKTLEELSALLDEVQIPYIVANRKDDLGNSSWANEILADWRKSGLTLDIQQVKDGERFKKIISSLNAADELGIQTRELGDGILDEARRLFAPDQANVRKEVIQLFAQPVTVETLSRQKHLARDLILAEKIPPKEAISVLQSNLGELNPRRRYALDPDVETDFLQKHAEELTRRPLVNTMVDYQFSLAPDFSLEILRQCQPGHSLCDDLVMNGQFWYSMFDHPNTSREAWEHALGKFWPRTAYTLAHRGSFNVPADLLDKWLTSGKVHWNEDHGAWITQLIEDNLLAKPAFRSHPMVGKFLLDFVKHEPNVHPQVSHEFFLIGKSLISQDPESAAKLVDFAVTKNVTGKDIIELLKTEPWSSHPLKDAWLKLSKLSMGIPENGGMAQDRAKSLKRSKMFHPNLDREVKKWAEAVKAKSVYTPGFSCMRAIGKLLGH